MMFPGPFVAYANHLSERVINQFVVNRKRKTCSYVPVGTAVTFGKGIISGVYMSSKGKITTLEVKKLYNEAHEKHFFCGKTTPLCEAEKCITKFCFALKLSPM